MALDKLDSIAIRHNSFSAWLSLPHNIKWEEMDKRTFALNLQAENLHALVVVAF